MLVLTMFRLHWPRHGNPRWGNVSICCIGTFAFACRPPNQDNPWQTRNSFDDKYAINFDDGASFVVELLGVGFPISAYPFSPDDVLKIEPAPYFDPCVRLANRAESELNYSGNGGGLHVYRGIMIASFLPPFSRRRRDPTSGDAWIGCSVASF